MKVGRTGHKLTKIAAPPFDTYFHSAPKDFHPNLTLHKPKSAADPRFRQTSVPIIKMGREFLTVPYRVGPRISAEGEPTFYLATFFPKNPA